MTEWKITEKMFMDYYARLGKRAYVHKFTDTAEIRASTGGRGKAPKQPSDYIVVVDGLTFFAEVKHCKNKTSFPLGALQPGQVAAGRRIRKAGGGYFVFVNAASLGKWFSIPFAVIEDTLAKGKKSLPWTDLESFIWSPLS